MKLMYFWLLAALLVARAEAVGSHGSGSQHKSHSSEDDNRHEPQALDMKDKEDKCKDHFKCKEQTPTTKCSCEFSDAMNKTAQNMTGNVQVVLMAFLESAQIDIFLPTNMTFIQKMIKLWYKLKWFSAQGPDQKAAFDKIQEMQVGGNDSMRWGYGLDMEYVSIKMVLEISDSATSVDNSTGSCRLFDAMRNVSSNDSSMATQVNQTIDQMKPVLQNSSMTPDQQKSALCDLLDGLFNKSASLKQLLLSVEIKGMGPLNAFYDVAKKSKQLLGLNAIMSGPPETNPLMQALNSSSQAAANDSSVPDCNKQALKLFTDMCKHEMDGESDPTIRLKKISAMYQQFTMDMDGFKPFFNKINISNWGCIGDFGFMGLMVFPEDNNMQPNITTMPGASGANSTDGGAGGSGSNSNATGNCHDSYKDPLVTAPGSNSSLIASINATNDNWGKGFYFWGMQWGTSTWLNLRNIYMPNMTNAMSNTSKSDQEKHQTNTQQLDLFENQFINKTLFACIPIPGFGFLGQYQQCEGSTNSGSLKCPIPWSCMDARHKIVTPDAGGKCKFNDDLDEAMKTFDSSTQTSMQPFVNDMKNAANNATATGPQKLGAIVKVIQSLLTAQPNIKGFWDIHFHGWGNMKKLFECQGYKVKLD